MIKILILVLIAEIFTAIGHIYFKKCANAIAPYSLNGFDAHKRFVSDVMRMPLIWVGLFWMALSLGVWLIALAQGDLSLVYPMTSLQYVMILFLAHIFLGEKIDRMKLLGTFLVAIGIVMISVS